MRGALWPIRRASKDYRIYIREYFGAPSGYGNKDSRRQIACGVHGAAGVHTERQVDGGNDEADEERCEVQRRRRILTVRQRHQEHQQHHRTVYLCDTIHSRIYLHTPYFICMKHGGKNTETMRTATLTCHIKVTHWKFHHPIECIRIRLAFNLRPLFRRQSGRMLRFFLYPLLHDNPPPWALGNKNLPIANRSRVSCAHNTSRASMITALH